MDCEQISISEDLPISAFIIVVVSFGACNNTIIRCIRPSAGITSAISKFSAAAQLGAAPGAGSGALSISEDERWRILQEEQRQLDVLKVLFIPPLLKL